MSRVSRVGVGATEIVLLVDSAGPFPFPASRVFPGVTAAEWGVLCGRYGWTPDSPEVLAGRVNCWLVRQPSRTILIDTGMGAPAQAQEQGSQGRLIDLLHEEGVEPGDVDVVFMTHLDADHTGGCVRDIAGEIRPAFENATYIAPRGEYAFCIQGGPPRHNPSSVASVRLELVDGETKLADGIHAVPAPGHSPAHFSVWISDGGASILLAGDALYHPLQIPSPQHPWPFDTDRSAAQATRERLIEEVTARKALLSATHFPFSGVGALDADDQGIFWRPLP